MKKYFFYYFVFVILSFLNCTINGKITNCIRETIRVNSLYLSKSNKLHIHDGNAVILLQLSKIKILRIQPEVFRTYEKKLFCLTEITFRDGTTLGSFSTEKPQVYVAAEQRLCGKIQDGEYRTLLNDIIKVEFIE